MRDRVLGGEGLIGMGWAKLPNAALGVRGTGFCCIHLSFLLPFGVDIPFNALPEVSFVLYSVSIFTILRSCLRS